MAPKQIKKKLKRQTSKSTAAAESTETQSDEVGKVFHSRLAPVLAFAAGAIPTLAYASVESSLMAIQSKLINFVLPVGGIIGLIFAGLSFVMGRENARSHLILALIGAGVGFGAPSLIEFIRGVVN
ncbi:MAG: hypothetical protein JST16_02830 [Bdellovibrionales bacterium]|nr:hypothetical protein [Bdellovibrionales bacterium]